MTLATQRAEVHPRDSTIPIVLSPGDNPVSTRGIPTDTDRDLSDDERSRVRGSVSAITIPTGDLPAEPVGSVGLKLMAHGLLYQVYRRRDLPDALTPGVASSTLIIVPVEVV